jgi:hypothetical protein
MRKHVWVYNLIAAIFIFCLVGTGHVPLNVSIADDSSCVSTERWDTITERVAVKGIWEFCRKVDGTVTVTGEWAYEDAIRCPFKDVKVTISDPSFSFDVKGTATNSLAMPGEQEAPYTLKIKGEMVNGKGNGTFKLDFFGYNWPSGFRASWTGTRIGGSGIFK